MEHPDIIRVVSMRSLYFLLIMIFLSFRPDNPLFY